MRLLASFLGAVLVALGLFALMLVLVTPPRDDSEPDQELVRVNFVRSLQDTRSDSRERQLRELPDRPQPPEPTPQPQPPRPEQPRTDLNLNISIPNLASPINVSSNPPPQALSAGPAAPVSLPVAPAPAAAAAEISDEVTPLIDVPPNYPQRALSAGIEGEVTLAFTITAEGRVENLRVTHAEPPGVFDREARRAAMRWRFAPRTEGGQPVAREATKTVQFRLEGRR
jgi:periplasmic protein TonB